MTVTRIRRLALGTRELDLGSDRLGELSAYDGPLDYPELLRARLAEDGYLLLRGFQNRATVLEARRRLIAMLRQRGVAEGDADPLVARHVPGSTGGLGHAQVANCPEFMAVVESARIRGLIESFYGTEAMTFTFKWMRVVPPGDFTGAHYDVVYMGRGSMGVLTVWTPFGDLSYDHGTLALVPGSHRLPGYQCLRDTYGTMDVDRDRVAGSFADDPLDVVERFGGRWATTEFQAGDVLIFGMYMMHMSLVNRSPELRLSADTRWQKASEPADERWVGHLPRGHYAWQSEPNRMISMADKRREWGV